ncbi:L1 capsid protein [Bos taurus papillomavirus 18]|uniref:Major capsid protein L1 n=1 Tax=Bos taurus papillomavirus 18 TaxID=1887216 RepID=A0A1B2K221_9PAPI|nr:L1 capsid protein [Bos taurus papillomavirus 18]ANZ90249.1 L1 capsid protein [Bos taurus papillomavirus 18]
MAVWVPSKNKYFYPATPVARILSTDDYVQRTGIFYHGSSDRLLAVGNPQHEVTLDGGGRIPKVSPQQYRTFRLKLPDPNQFAFPDKDFYDPSTERLVWGLAGVQVDRGGPLGIGVSGHPLTNKFHDVENQGLYLGTQGVDDRQNVGSDGKQMQLLIVGSQPSMGEHWGIGETCTSEPVKEGECPPLKPFHTVIEDGDMLDMGYGNFDFAALQLTKSGVPLEITQEKCKYPDFIGMSQDTYGDRLFFWVRHEQLYLRHFNNKAGTIKETLPESLYYKTEDHSHSPIDSHMYYGSPSMSLVSSANQIFSKPYWLVQSQGANNGMLWFNDLFITAADNTRGVSVHITVKKEDAGDMENYTSSNFNIFTRHCEQYDISFIVELCKVPLTPETVTLLHQMNPKILERWNLGVNPPSTSVADTYRFLQNQAHTCQKQNTSTEEDMYKDYKFWTVDMTDKLSADLSQFNLGRKFMMHFNRNRRTVRGTNKRVSTNSNTNKTVKRRRKNV